MIDSQSTLFSIFSLFHSHFQFSVWLCVLKDSTGKFIAFDYFLRVVFFFFLSSSCDLFLVPALSSQKMNSGIFLVDNLKLPIPFNILFFFFLNESCPLLDLIIQNILKPPFFLFICNINIPVSETRLNGILCLFQLEICYNNEFIEYPLDCIKQQEIKHIGINL